MNDKQQILTTLRGEFDRWEELLASLSEEQITAPHLLDTITNPQSQVEAVRQPGSQTKRRNENAIPGLRSTL